MADRLFSASRWGQQLFNQSGSRRLTVSTMGESHGMHSRLGAAIQYAVWRHYHADIVYDHRTYANGGSQLAVGATTTTGDDGLTDQLVQFQARPTDIAFIASGYNDQPANSAAAVTVSGTVIGVADDLFAAGAKYVVICGITPFDGNNAPASLAYNQLIRNYCAATQGAFFLDVTAIVADFQNSGATDMPYRDISTYAAGVYNSMTEDGAHWSGYAIRLIAADIADILKKIVGVRTPRQTFNAGTYHPTTAPYVNMLGDAGNCMGTAGLLAFEFDTGVAGIDATSRLSITVTGDVSVTPSIVTGDHGERKQRLTLGGSEVDTNTFVQIDCQPTITGVDGGVATRKLDYECMVDLAAVTGLSDITLRPLASANDSAALNDVTKASNRWLDDTTESLFARTLYPVDVPSGNNPTFSIFLHFGFGATPAGTIDLSRMSACVVEE